MAAENPRLLKEDDLRFKLVVDDADGRGDIQLLGQKAINLQGTMDRYKSWVEERLPPTAPNALCLLGLHKTADILIDDSSFSFYIARTYCLRCGEWGWQKDRTPDKIVGAKA